MATALQWPRPSGFDDEVADPLVLVDRFKQHYISICHHTADNPTATASASYVMDVMFQANKVITLLANQLSLSLLASRQHAEANLVPNTTQVVGQDRLSVEHEARAGPGNAVDEGAEDVVDNAVGTILDINWGEEDSSGDQDWEDDCSSEQNSEDDYYEYGDFEDDDDEEEENEGGGGCGIESRDGQGNETQAGLADATNETAGHDAENLAVGTILNMNWNDEGSEGDRDWEDNGSSDHDSEDDYYEYGDFEDDEEEEQGPGEGKQQVGLDDPVNEAAQNAVENVVLGNVNDNEWADEDSEGDQDWEDNDSSDQDSEDDYYEYGDFGDDGDDRHEGENQQGNRDEHQGGIEYGLQGGNVVVNGHDQSIGADTPGWRDVYDWISETNAPNTGQCIETTRLSTLETPNQSLSFTIHWNSNPPYRAWESQGLNYEDIKMHHFHALNKILDPALRPESTWKFDVISETGDIELHFNSATDRTRAVNNIPKWFHFLERSEVARIPGVYNPLRRAKSNAKNAKRRRSPLAEAAQGNGSSDEISKVQDELNGIEKDKEGCPSPQTRSERRLERRRAKRRQKRREQKLRKNADLMAWFH